MTTATPTIEQCQLESVIVRLAKDWYNHIGLTQDKLSDERDHENSRFRRDENRVCSLSRQIWLLQASQEQPTSWFETMLDDDTFRSFASCWMFAIGLDASTQHKPSRPRSKI
jgi:hypothetical protein